MQGALIVGIVFSGIVMALAVIGGTIIMIVKMIRGGGSRKNRQQSSEETKVIQEVFQGLERMEKRVEALETLLMDQQDQKPIQRP